MTTLRPFFSFYGAKWRAVPKYPAPRHDLIVEPFAGSASYSVRYPDHRILLVDTDEYICGVWQYLIRASVTEILSLPDLEPGQSVDDIVVPQEARWLIGFWLNAASSSPCKTMSISGRKTPADWAAQAAKRHYSTPRPLFWGPLVRERLASQVDRIRHWKVVHADYRMSPDVEATWFVDPPYEVAGKHYRYRISDYPALGSWCRELRGQVIACEGAGATWLPFRPLGMFKSAGVNGKPYAAEQVWLNAS